MGKPWKPVVIEPLDLLIVEERMRERVEEGMELPAGMDAQGAALWALMLAEAARCGWLPWSGRR